MVGLGNPGVEYYDTRHNLGFEVVDRLARRVASGETAKSKFHGLLIETHVDGDRLLLLRPMTYMNRSGISVAECVSFYKLDPKEDLLVIADDVALSTGAIRIRPSGSAGGHNGLSDIESRIGTDSYTRMRIGIGAPNNRPQKDHVLGHLTAQEKELMEPGIETAIDAALCWMREGTQTAMNRYNRRGVGASADTPTN